MNIQGLLAALPAGAQGMVGAASQQGLLGGMEKQGMGGMQPGQPPSTPGIANPQPQQGGFLSGIMDQVQSPEFMQRLNLFGAQLQDIEDGGQRAQGITAAQEAQQAQMQEQQQRQELNQLADSLNMSPEERLLFLRSPEAWARVQESRQESYTLGQGQGRYQGGEEAPDAYNNRTGVDGGFGYTVGQDGIAVWNETGRPVSEVEQARIDDYESREADRQARLGLAQAANGRAAAAAQRAAARGRGGSGRTGGRPSSPPSGFVLD